MQEMLDVQMNIYRDPRDSEWVCDLVLWDGDHKVDAKSWKHYNRDVVVRMADVRLASMSALYYAPNLPAEPSTNSRGEIQLPLDL
jgi:hypothetical protein